MRKSYLYPGVLLAAVTLCGCPHFTHVAGPPCMGNACPAGTKGEPPAAQHADYKQPAAADQPPASGAALAPAQSSATGNAEPTGGAAADSAQAGSAQAASAQQKPGLFTRMLEALHLHSKS